MLNAYRINDLLEEYGIENQFTLSILDSETFTVSGSILTTAIDYKTGDLVRLKTSGTLPAPLAIGTDYFVIVVSTSEIQLATSRENAFLSEPITLTDTGTGTHTIQLLTYKAIQSQIENSILPWIEGKARQSFSGVKQYSEFYSGNGGDVIVLNRRPIVSLDNVRYLDFADSQNGGSSGYDVEARTGIVRYGGYTADGEYISRYWPRGEKNIEITYTAGYAEPPAGIENAIYCIAAVWALKHLADRTGGGEINGGCINRTYGKAGKYWRIISSLNKQAHSALSPYMTGVVNG